MCFKKRWILRTSKCFASNSSGEIQCLAVDTAIPSAFSHEILNANPYAYLDDAPLEERRARAVSMRRILPESLSEAAMLDPAAIKQVSDQCWPDLRTADELHDAMLSMIVIPANMEAFERSRKRFMAGIFTTADSSTQGRYREISRSGILVYC